MTARLCRQVGLAAALFVAAACLLAGSGCVSSKYKLAPKADHATPAPALRVTATAPGVSATLDTVIVFHGPGSWKRDAYWDEYVVTLAASGNRPLVVDRVALVDGAGQVTPAGYEPWELDARSRKLLKVARHTGRDIALGAGASAAWLGSMALFASNLTICGGVASTTSATVGAFGVVGIPLVALGSGVRTLVARGSIHREFDRRRFVLPATLPPGSTRTGSFFFPVTPGPARLLIRCHEGAAASQELALDLAPLASLHLKPAAAAVPRAASGP